MSPSPRTRILPIAAMVGMALSGCRHASVRPPALFPMESVAVVQIDDLIEGPLASDGLRLFVTTRGGSIKAFDAAGAPLWSLTEAPGQAAAATGGLIVRHADGTVRSLDPENGETRWISDSGVKGTLPPVIDLDRVLLAGQGIAALDMATGRPLWSLPGLPEVTAVPVSFGPWTLIGEADGTLRCRDRATGFSLWTFKTERGLLAPPLVDARRRVFLGTTDRRILAIKPAHHNPAWRWRVGADVQSGGALRGNRVLFAAFDNVLYCLNRRNGNLIWRVSLPSRPLSGPILVGEAVVLACQESEILGFDARGGRKLGGLKTPSEIRTPPLVVGDRLYVGLRDRSVAIYKLNMTPSTLSPSTPRPAAGSRQSPS